MNLSFSKTILFLSFLVVATIGAMSLSVPHSAQAQEKTTVGGACATGANAADWDTLMQCSASAWKRGHYWLGSATDNAGASLACNAGNAGLIQWTGTYFQACDGSSWKALSSTAISEATYDNKTVLMLHMDGSNGGTTFTDSSVFEWPVTRYNATTSTAQYKFGTASGLFNGSNAYLTVPGSSSFEFGSGDFTIDFWLRPTAISMNGIVSRQNGALYPSWLVLMNSDNNVDFYFCSSACGSSWETFAGPARTRLHLGAASAGTWSHFAIVRSGNTFYGFKDGVLTESGTNSAAIPTTTSSALSVGEYYGGYYLNGYLDELRITKGRALWTSNFTPPTEADNPTSESCPYIPSGSQIFTSSGTFTPPSGVSSTCPLEVRVAMIGGGGGGNGSYTSSCGGSGGGGSGNLIAFQRLLTTTASIPVTIGAAGSGGALNANNASIGGASYFGGISTIYGNPGNGYTGGLGSGGGGGGGGGSNGCDNSVVPGNGGAGGAIGVAGTQGAGTLTNNGYGQGGGYFGSSSSIASTTNIMGIVFQSATFAAGSGGTGGTAVGSNLASLGGAGGAGYGAGGGGGGAAFPSRNNGGGGGGAGGLVINGSSVSGATGGSGAAGGAGAPGVVYVEWGASTCTPSAANPNFPLRENICKKSNGTYGKVTINWRTGITSGGDTGWLNNQPNNGVSYYWQGGTQMGGYPWVQVTWTCSGSSLTPVSYPACVNPSGTYGQVSISAWAIGNTCGGMGSTVPGIQAENNQTYFTTPACSATEWSYVYWSCN